MRTLPVALLALVVPFELGLVGGCVAPAPTSHSLRLTPRAPDATPRVLAVVAHPDDETAFAATLYATSRLLGGTCDVVVLTNGEGGFKYATVAEPLYGLELTDEAVGRRELPGIRRSEMVESCRVLGVRELVFLGQRDHRYTTDEGEVLDSGAGVWDLDLVRARLAERIEAGGYELVFCMLPTEGTHGHHKAATILALEAVAEMPLARRPAVLGATVEDDDERVEPDADGLPGWPLTALAADAPRYVFDRRRTFGHRDGLDWRVVVDLAIAQHRSQGTLQMLAGREAREVFFPFAVGPPDAGARAAELFERLAAAGFPERAYGPSAGTNASSTTP